MKNRFDILRVIARYLAVERKGAAYVALCPFHPDRHPSLRIDPSKGLYHCFSCGAGGDALRFVMEKEGCDFKQALHLCQDICGLSGHGDGACPRLNPRLNPASKGESKPASHPKSPSDGGGTGTGPLCPAGYGLLPYDAGDAALCSAYAAFGVGLAPAHPPRAYAFTRGRLVFPIHDRAGRLVAFAARYLGDTLPEGCPKYLNSPASALYKKDELLYGWPQAVDAIRATASAVVVEGYKDCLAMHAAGLTHTVALCGVNLSDHHLAALLGEGVTSLLLFLDNDAAGHAATEKIAARLATAAPRLATLRFGYGTQGGGDGGKDADEIFRRLGPEALRAQVADASVPPALRQAEDDLLAACSARPATPCVSGDGSLRPFVDYIRELLTYEDLWPLRPANRLALTSLACPEGAWDASAAHVPDSQRIERLLLRYLELRLCARVRRHAQVLRRETAAARAATLALLQADREYLREVSQRLRRR